MGLCTNLTRLLDTNALIVPDSPGIDLEDVAEECLHSEHNPQSFQPFQIQSLHNLSLCEVHINFAFYYRCSVGITRECTKSDYI